MRNLWFNAQRALFSQPLGMTLNIVRVKLHRRTGQPSTPKPPLPIDMLYGIDTAGIVNASALRTGSRSDLQNFGYGASLPSVIRRAIERCPNLEMASFVDLGCGKGLPLAVATEYPFRRIIGVELSPKLCATGRENAARIAAAYPDRTEIEIVEGDASAFEFPSGYVIVYLYNPVYPRLLDLLAERIADHQARENKVMVICCNPTYAKSFDRRPVFARYFAARLAFDEDEAAASPYGNSSDSVVIWQGMGDPMFEPFPGANAAIIVTPSGSHGTVQPV
jgi:SAM-dependent methyltransferase